MRFTARVDSPADAATTFAHATDWEAQTRFVPMTRVWLTRGDGGVGSRFTGRTGIGPLAFDDPMEVVEMVPPAGGADGVARVVKLGSVVTGRAEVVVQPRPGGGSRVLWTEDIELAPARLTRPFGPLIAAAGRLGFTLVLRRMVRELSAGQAGQAGQAGTAGPGPG